MGSEAERYGGPVVRFPLCMVSCERRLFFGCHVEFKVHLRYPDTGDYWLGMSVALEEVAYRDQFRMGRA